tara:strand:- start:132 stop:239 length:108 start_codon:yes stop_codon:yes gene_type:complete
MKSRIFGDGAKGKRYHFKTQLGFILYVNYTAADFG